MSNYIVKYRRGNEVKYISHLDFIRFMQRVMRRAELPMAFSNGFNPHPIMSVAQPLSVGVTADGEYIKIGLAKDFDENTVKDTLNNAFPKGFEVIAVKKSIDKEYDFNKINRAEYICILKTKSDFSAEKFMGNEQLIVMKKSKSGAKETDIKGHIHSISVEKRDDNSITLKMCIDCGNLYNLKPDTVIEAIKKYTKDFECDFYLVHRSRLLADNKELF